MQSRPSGGSSAVGNRTTTFRYSLSQTLRLIRSDIAFRRSYQQERPGWLGSLRLLMSPGVGCGIRYRLQCLFFSNRLAPLGSVFKFLNLVLYGVDIDEGAQIGGCFLIGHPISILITADVTIGERCVVYHHTTIGRSPVFETGLEPGPIIIGEDVIFGMGSCAYGKIVIGDGCRVGANTVVDRSFPPGSCLSGVPARIVNNPTEQKGAG